VRVLLLYPEFPPSFWTLRETCVFSRKKTLLPPLGLITVAALLPREWKCRLVDLNASPLTDGDWEWAELVLLSGMIVQREGLLSLIREAKRRGKATVVGGPYATSMPQEVLAAGADFLLRGEGEPTVPLFLAAWRAGEKSGVFQHELKPDLTASPLPRFDLLNFNAYIDLSIQTSRGCPFDCEFCDVVNLFGRKPRYKEPEQVLAELEALYRLGWRGTVFIGDDNFIGNQDHARGILTRLLPWMESHGHPFSFWTQASINLGQAPALIDLMTAANFSDIFIGVESPDEELLAAARKYQNLRNPMAESLHNICAQGLSLVASFVIGFDQEKPGAGERICAFVEQNHIPVVMVNLLQPLPNTSLWQRLEQTQRLLSHRPSGDSYGLQLNYVPTRPGAEILREYVDVVDRLYEPSRYLARVYQYYLTMRPTRRFLGLIAAKPGRPRPHGRPANRPLPGSAFLELRKLLRLLWRQGVLAPYRRQFWRQLAGIYRGNPSRLKKYLVTCGFGEDLFWIRKLVLQKAAQLGLRPD